MLVECAVIMAAAAFLLSILMKECDGRVVDTTLEDGACKAVLPSGASVRPLLIAASYTRGRGPGLVESFDRAATAHMQRTPRVPSVTPGRASVPDSDGPRPVRPRPGNLAVKRAELEAVPLCLVAPGSPRIAPPRVSMRLIAEEYWGSMHGQEIAASSKRVGTFTLADIDALERHATKTFDLLGLAPPGTPWPWKPSEEHTKLMIAWGAIVGEVLGGVYGGLWEADPASPDDQFLSRVVLADTLMTWPVMKVYLRLARGISHDLTAYADAVGRAAGRQATRSMSG
jgi:hypothetical protein